MSECNDRNITRRTALELIGGTGFLAASNFLVGCGGQEPEQEGSDAVGTGSGADESTSENRDESSQNDGIVVSNVTLTPKKIIDLSNGGGEESDLVMYIISLEHPEYAEDLGDVVPDCFELQFTVQNNSDVRYNAIEFQCLAEVAVTDQWGDTSVEERWITFKRRTVSAGSSYNDLAVTGLGPHSSKQYIGYCEKSSIGGELKRIVDISPVKFYERDSNTKTLYLCEDEYDMGISESIYDDETSSSKLWTIKVTNTSQYKWGGPDSPLIHLRADFFKENLFGGSDDITLIHEIVFRDEMEISEGSLMVTEGFPPTKPGESFEVLSGLICLEKLDRSVTVNNFGTSEFTSITLDQFGTFERHGYRSLARVPDLEEWDLKEDSFHEVFDLISLDDRYKVVDIRIDNFEEA